MSVQWRFEGNFDDVFKAALKQQLEHVRDAMDQVRCPVHGEAPTIVVTGQTAEAIAADVQGCCDELGRLAKAKLATLGFEKDV
jgi:hypothetical protein